jgi:hypothetical protein
MPSVALAISYVYQFLGVLVHAYELYKLRVEQEKLAYEYLQETMADLAMVRGTYLELKKAEAQVLNSELTLGISQRAHLDSLRTAIARIRQRARENTPTLAAA